MIGHHPPMQPRPRVLAVAQSAEPGGAELALQRVAERLPAHGFEVDFAGLPIGNVRRGGWPRALLSWPKARRAARAADVVLMNGVATQRLAPAMTDAVLVPYIHELVEDQPRVWRSARFWQAAPIVMCACEAVAQRCRALGVPDDRLRTVYAPVEAVDAAPKPDWAGRPVVGFVGRIEPHKGALDLVRAMRGVDAKLVIVGSGAGDYADAVRHEAGERAVFAGQVEDARALMSSFTVLAVPSYTEAFGTVAAEALAAGTPVVATRGTGIEEYVRPGENGELVMAGDSEALAAAINRVLPRAQSMAAPARESVRRFGVDTVATAIADALSEALERRGGSIGTRR
jgi:glycosyltransferase involved in cell wall biosynthesis